MLLRLPKYKRTGMTHIMNYNFHTHTYRCHHASGTEEEYIKRAIENGITHMGFSDHVPLVCSDGFESYHRVPMAQAEEYIATLRELREKYKDQLTLYIGFEAEYFPLYFDQMVEHVTGIGCEYLILGQHFLYGNHARGSASKTESEEDLNDYVNGVLTAIKSGYITYVAHPDMIAYVGDEAVYRRAVETICNASKEYDVPLEINFLGIRDNRFYPHEEFWQIAGEIGSPVTFGFDAHDVPSSYDGASIPKAEALVERCGLNYIGMPKLRLLSSGK